MFIVRLVALALAILAGIGFGMFGLADPMNFQKAASIICLLASILLFTYDYLEG